MSFLSRFFSGNTPSYSAAEEAAPAPEANIPVRGIDYAIYAQADLTLAVLPNAFPENFKVQQQNGTIATLRSTGTALNQTSLRTHIDINRKNGKDVSAAEAALKDLEALTAEKGLTDKMDQLRITGYFVGDKLEEGQIRLRSVFPANPDPRRVQIIIPQFA